MQASVLARSVVAVGLFSIANAAVSQTCFSDICYSLNIPDSTASAGTGDIYFQISAPTTYEWVALGQGSQMAGANIFVMYTSADGQNVTISPRVGVGHVEPENTGASAAITLLEGSGVSNGTMLANVRCGNCASWSGGSMDFTSSSSTSWIHAARSGQSLDSDSLSEELSIHDDEAAFDWDLAAATGGSDVNPFVTAGDDSTSTTDTTTTTTTTTQSSSSYPSTEIMIAHGVLASLAWVIFMPTGAILLRMLPSANVVRIHAGFQILGYMIYIAAFGIGVWMAMSLSYLSNKHAIIGIVVFVLASIQPVSGLLHHLGFKKNARRGIWSIMHLTFGRVAVILGIINGGLGLQLTGVSTGALAAYGVVAGVFGVTFLAVSIFGEVRRNSNKQSGGNRSPRSVEKDNVSRVSNNGSPRL